jgi:hypothetical protein
MRRYILRWLWQFYLFRWPCTSLIRLLPDKYGSVLFFESPLAEALHSAFIRAGDFQTARSLAADMNDYANGSYAPSRHT